MNLVFVHTSSFQNCGGIGRVTEINALNFKKKGHKVWFLILKEGKIDNCFGFTQFYLKSNDLTSEINKTYFREKLKELKADIIINQSGVNVSALNFIVESKIDSAKVITCYHGAIKSIYDNYDIILRGNVTNKLLKHLFQIKALRNFFQWNYKRKMKRNLKFVIDSSDKLILLSKGYISELDFYDFEYKKSKVDYVNNPVKYENFPKRKFNKKDVLLYVGRINFSEKQCNLLPPIWNRISKKHPNFVLKIVGDGNKLSELKNIFKEHNEADRVEFLGYTNPFPYYEEASILLLTSAIEGFGLVLTEALNYDVIPIAFDVSHGVREALMKGESGVLVKPFDLDEYVRKLDELILDKNLRNNLLEQHNEVNAGEKNKIIYEKWFQIFEQLKN